MYGCETGTVGRELLEQLRQRVKHAVKPRASSWVHASSVLVTSLLGPAHRMDPIQVRRVRSAEAFRIAYESSEENKLRIQRIWNAHTSLPAKFLQRPGIVCQMKHVARELGWEWNAFNNLGPVALEATDKGE